MENQHPSGNSQSSSGDPKDLLHQLSHVPQLAYIFQQPQPGSVGGLIVMPLTTYQYKPPSNHVYRPSNFMLLSLVTVFFCGVFSPPTLALSIPALMFSIKSSNSANAHDIRLARTQGMIAAYLNLTAIIIALIFAIILTGIILGLEGRDYSLRMCISRVSDRNGGMLPTPPTSTNGGSNFFNERFRC